jgi:hypothetical protein
MSGKWRKCYKRSKGEKMSVIKMDKEKERRKRHDMSGWGKKG